MELLDLVKYGGGGHSAGEAGGFGAPSEEWRYTLYCYSSCGPWLSRFHYSLGERNDSNTWLGRLGTGVCPVFYEGEKSRWSVVEDFGNSHHSHLCGSWMEYRASGAGQYYGRAEYDQFNYVITAQLLMDSRPSEVQRLTDSALLLKAPETTAQLISQSVLHAELSILSLSDAQETYGATTQFFLFLLGLAGTGYLMESI